MQLGIGTAAGVLAKQRRHQALGVDLVDAVATATSDTAVTFQPVEGGHHRGVVRRQHLGPDKGSGDKAHSTETLLGAENVASKPRADLAPKARPS